MLTGILIAIGFVLAVILLRSVTTLIHELGHAIPALLYTEDEVSIFLGSYNDISKSSLLNFGRLSIYFRLNILAWMLGLCSHKKANSVQKEMVIVVGGPLASLALALFTSWCIINLNQPSDFVKSLCTLIILSSSFDFLVNAIPSKTGLYLYDGTVMYNDGQQFLKLIKESKLPKAYFDAVQLFKEKKYQEAKICLENLINQNIISESVNRQLIDVYIELGEYDKAIENMSQYSSLKKMQKEDNAKLGFIFFALGAYDKALNYYNNAIHYDYTNAFYLNGRGLVKEKLEDPNGAIVDFRAAASYNEGLSDPYVHMARIYFNMGHKEEAKKLLDTALSINENNANAYYYLGKYYDDKNHKQSAYDNFCKAEKLGCREHGLDFYLGNLLSDLNNISK